MAVTVLSLLKICAQIWGRWYATRATKRLQLSVRKRAFEHAVRLPLHRVHELKSGGVASVLREDAGSVGELIFGMLYNPWRAVVQLAGSIAVLAWADWRLLIGSLVLVPLVFLTHRTWISRIRPQHKAIRARRESIDAHTTESFSGMRVVRGFSREHSEAGRFMRSNDLMARQELLVWWWARIVEICWEGLIPRVHRPPDALRRMASPQRRPYPGRPDDVSGLPGDALGAAGGAGRKRGDLPKQPLRPRPHSRLARRTARHAADGRLGAAAEGANPRPRRARRRLVHLSRRCAAGVGACVARRGAGTDGGSRRSQRRRQDDPVQSCRPVLRSDRRPRDARRHRPARHRRGTLSQPLGCRGAGRLSLRRHHCREHCLFQPVGDRGRSPPGRSDRERR